MHKRPFPLMGKVPRNEFGPEGMKRVSVLPLIAHHPLRFAAVRRSTSPCLGEDLVVNGCATIAEAM